MPTGAFHKLNIYEGKDALNYAMIMPVQGQIYSGHCPERYIVIKKSLMMLCCIPATKSACHHTSFIWYDWLSTPLGGLSYRCLEPEYTYKITNNV